MQIELLVKEAFENANRNGYYFYSMEPIEIAYDMVDFDSDIGDFALTDDKGDIDSDKFEMLTTIIQNNMKDHDV